MIGRIGFLVIVAIFSRVHAIGQKLDSLDNFVYVEKLPEYPGGEDQLFKFVKENLEYPAHSFHKRIEGKVITEFIIDTLGDVTNVKIIKGVNAEIDQEAERIIKQMGRWNAGSQGGQKVRVLFRLPILFKIDRYTKRKFKLKKLDQ